MERASGCGVKGSLVMQSVVWWKTTEFLFSIRSRSWLWKTYAFTSLITSACTQIFWSKLKWKIHWLHALNSKSHSELISQCFTAVTQYSNESASHKCNHAVCFGSDVICNIFRSTKFYTALFAPKKKEEKITAHNHRVVEEEDFRKFPSAWNNEPFGVLFNKKRDEKREKGVFFLLLS